MRRLHAVRLLVQERAEAGSSAVHRGGALVEHGLQIDSLLGEKFSCVVVIESE